MLGPFVESGFIILARCHISAFILCLACKSLDLILLQPGHPTRLEASASLSNFKANDQFLVF